MLEVRNSGGKTYYQRYRDCRGRERQFKIGPAGALTLRQARRKARQVVAQALLGRDPHQQRQELRTMSTLSEFVRERYMPFAEGAKRSWQTDETLLRLHILPILGKLPLDDISNRSVADLLRGLRDSGYASGTTNRVLVLLRFIYNTANKWGIPGATNNPTVGFVTEPDVCRQRFLSDYARIRKPLHLPLGSNRTS
jgi:hypothetical protein